MKVKKRTVNRGSNKFNNYYKVGIISKDQKVNQDMHHY